MDGTLLTRLCWRSVRVVLQNTRNTCAREHPLSIFDAIFKFAAGRTVESDPERTPVDFFFHPLERTGNGIRKGTRYELELVFPHAPDEACTRFLDGLAAWLEDPAHNFALRECGPVRQRSLCDLLEEHPLPETTKGETREVCLDFLTPLSLATSIPSRRRELDGSGLFRLFADRLRRWYGTEADAALEGFRPALESARLLPWFWDYVEFHHRAKSHHGKQYVCGMCGPLYVRGDIPGLWPLLLLGQELHLGSRHSAGRGAYRLRTDHPCLDRKLEDPHWYASARARCSLDTDVPFGPSTGEDAEAALALLREVCASGQYEAGTAEIFMIRRDDGGQRPVAQLSPEDVLAQRAVLEMIGPALNASLPETVIGFRTGSGTRDARLLVREAATDGRTWLLRTDINHFFESIPHAAMLERLDECIPEADTSMRHFLRQVLEMPARYRSAPWPREQGLLQGSPLSPLLSNLYLRPVDTAMIGHGFPCIRFGDDILIPVVSREAAEKALELLRHELDKVGLTLNESKTSLHEQDECRFPGLDMEEDDDTFLSPAAARNPLYVQQWGAFVGVDGDSVLIRRDHETVGRVPLHVISEIYLFGAGAVSSRLIHKCAREGVPLSFCTPTGWHYGTLHPCPRDWYTRIAAHTERHAALTPSEVLEAARALVRTKIRSGIRWLLPRTSERDAVRTASAQALEALETAESVAQVMGVEGAFARRVFAAINGLIRDDAFRAELRIPRAKPDNWNALLDACYSLLFTRLHVRLQSAGLNPYLGFLHSPQDKYPSLTADLQEPFRHRMDRLAVRMVNQNIIRAEHFVWQGGRRRLEPEGRAALLRAFERELDRRPVDECRTLRQGMALLIATVREWVCRGVPLCLDDEILFPPSSRERRSLFTEEDRETV